VWVESMMTATAQSAPPMCNLTAIVEAMKRPEMYPDHPRSVEVRQTHVSYAFSDKRVAVQGRGAWLKSAALQKAKRAGRMCAAVRLFCPGVGLSGHNHRQVRQAFAVGG
jgi:hypothetical protein